MTLEKYLLKGTKGARRQLKGKRKRYPKLTLQQLIDAENKHRKKTRWSR